MKIRVGIDARSMIDPQNEKGGGIERYTFTLATKLIQAADPEFEYVFFVNKNYQSKHIFKTEQSSVVEIPKYSIPFFGAHYLCAKFLEKQNLDLMHFPSPDVPYFYKKKKIITVHDLAIYDHPEWFPRNQFFAKNVIVPHAIKTAEHVIAVSKDTKKSVQEKFNIQDKKISVIYNEIPDIKYFNKEVEVQLPEKYILSISTLEPRKNYNMIFNGFLEYRKKFRDHKLMLVVIGGVGWRIEEVFKDHPKEFLEKNNIVFLENIPEKTKQKIIDKSKGLVMISHHEGFGLPVLEAQKKNKPTLLSPNGALKEIGNENSIFCNEESSTSIALGIKSILEKQIVNTKSSSSFIKKLVTCYKQCT